MLFSLGKDRDKMNFFTKAILKMVETISLSKFCFIFTLRQGTIMIATVELSFSAFGTILLLLCLIHANHLVEMVTADIQQFENHFWYLKGDSEAPTYVFDNEKKMLIGQHLALFLKMVVCMLFFASIVYFISSILLLYGAIRRSPNHLLPWTSIGFISLVTALFWFLPFCYFILDNYFVVACVFLLTIYPLQFYAWLTVFSYYRQLTYKQFNKVDNTCIIDKVYHPQVIGVYK